MGQRIQKIVGKTGLAMKGQNSLVSVITINGVVSQNSPYVANRTMFLATSIMHASQYNFQTDQAGGVVLS